MNMKTKEQAFLESIINYVDLLAVEKEDEHHIQMAQRLTAEKIAEFIRSSAKIYEIDLREPLPFDKPTETLCEEIKHRSVNDGITNDTQGEYSHLTPGQREIMEEISKNKLNK